MGSKLLTETPNNFGSFTIVIQRPDVILLFTKGVRGQPVKQDIFHEGMIVGGGGLGRRVGQRFNRVEVVWNWAQCNNGKHSWRAEERSTREWRGKGMEVTVQLQIVDANQIWDSARIHVTWPGRGRWKDKRAWTRTKLRSHQPACGGREAHLMTGRSVER